MTAPHLSPPEIQPERLIPLSQIGGELARLTLENDRLLRRLHETIAEANSQIVAMRYERDGVRAGAAIAKADLKTLRVFVRGVWEEIHEASTPDIDTIRTMVDELVGEDLAGEDCHACDGKGAGRDEIPDAFGVQIHEGGCSPCDGTGRVSR